MIQNCYQNCHPNCHPTNKNLFLDDKRMPSDAYIEKLWDNPHNIYIHKQGVDETLCKTILRKLDFARELFEMDMKNYSDGQKKKVLIAVSLSKPAHIFVWDEPLNYIDVISRIQIEEIVKEAKPTLIFVEHDKRFVEDIANKIIQL